MYSGGDGSAGNPYQIANATDLNDVRENLSAYFIQTANISLATVADWTPIGASGTEFVGHYDGQYYAITDYASTQGGLFGYTETGATFDNIRLSGASYTLANSSFHGGLINKIRNATITDCVSDVDVTTYGQTAGSFAGAIYSGSLSKCIGKGNVVSKGSLGGFAGVIDGATAIIADCYSTGSVEILLNDYIGGFTSQIVSATVSNCYSIGAVTGTAKNLGGFCGKKWSGTTSYNFYDSTTSGKSDTIGATPKTTAQMQEQTTFTGWDFTSTWLIDTVYNNSYPNLFWYFNTFLAVPTNLRSYERTTVSIGIIWTASVSAVGYKIYVDDVYNGTTTDAHYSITGLTPDTTYSIQVLAYNTQTESEKSSAVSITTVDNENRWGAMGTILLSEAKNRILKTMNEYSISGEVISSTDENALDYLLRMNSLIDMHQRKIATTYKKISKCLRFTQYPLTNLTGVTGIQRFEGTTLYYEGGTGVKSYCVQVDGSCTITIEQSVDGTTYTTLESQAVTITTFGQFETVRSNVTPTTDYYVRMKISGTYDFNIASVALYGATYPTDSDIPVYDDYIEKTLPTDFYNIDYIVVGDNGNYKPLDDYRQENRTTLLIPFATTGEVRVYYWAYPTKIDDDTPDTTILDTSDEAIDAVICGVAMDLVDDEKSDLYQYA
jgi:hypothetical protein